MFRRLALLTLIFVAVAQPAALAKQSSKPIPTLDLFFRTTALDDRTARRTVKSKIDQKLLAQLRN